MKLQTLTARNVITIPSFTTTSCCRWLSCKSVPHVESGAHANHAMSRFHWRKCTPLVALFLGGSLNVTLNTSSVGKKRSLGFSRIIIQFNRQFPVLSTSLFCCNPSAGNISNWWMSLPQRKVYWLGTYQVLSLWGQGLERMTSMLCVVKAGWRIQKQRRHKISYEVICYSQHLYWRNVLPGTN